MVTFEVRIIGKKPRKVTVPLLSATVMDVKQMVDPGNYASMFLLHDGKTFDDTEAVSEMRCGPFIWIMYSQSFMDTRADLQKAKTENL
jgi:hypothetical protein